VPIICVNFRRGRSRGYNNNQRDPKRFCCCCWCCCASDCRMCSGAVMAFAIARLFGVARKPGVCSCIQSPMRSKHRVVNLESAAFPSCVCPISIPRGGDRGLFPKIGFEGFFLEGGCEYLFDTLKSVQRFGFENKRRSSGKIKPIRSRDAPTVVLVHSNMVIDEGTDGYQIRKVVVIRRRNCRKRVSNGSLMLDKPNKKRSKVRSNTYTLLRDVGTFNSRCDVVRLVLV